MAYQVHGDWGSGFVAQVTLRNTGESAVDGWRLEWTFPGGQTVTNLWNGHATQDGAHVSVTDAGWNGVIPAGASLTIGFQASYAGPNAQPAAFTVNGAACGAE